MLSNPAGLMRFAFGHMFYWDGAVTAKAGPRGSIAAGNRGGKVMCTWGARAAQESAPFRCAFAVEG